MWTQKFCLICIYILRNYAFQISNEALFLAFLQPVANRLKSFILPSNRMGKTSSASTFTSKGQLVFSSSLFAGKFMSLQVCNIVDPPEANAPVHLWFRPKPIQCSLDSFA